MLDHQDIFPSHSIITNGKKFDISIAEKMEFEKRHTYVMDRAYFDAKWLYKLHQNGSFFVIRLKKNIIHTILFAKKLTGENVREEKIIQLIGSNSQAYEESLRVITIYNPYKNEKFYCLQTTKKPRAEELADIYKKRFSN